jgi:hypothetical protein
VPQQSLCLRPEPQGHGALRAIVGTGRRYRRYRTA